MHYLNLEKQIILFVSLLILLSCKEKFYAEEIDRNKFCKYFPIQFRYHKNGGHPTTASPVINIISNDKTSDFINNHPQRFDYLIFKTFLTVWKRESSFDSSILNNKFCKALSTDTFYNNFRMLTGGHKNTADKDKKNYSIIETMNIASRFFYCDNINKTDTTIGYHICAGINGIAELQSSKDYTALEAFCFEAIFKNLKRDTKLVNNFHNYIHSASRESKSNFTDFQTHLTIVKNKCFTAMANDRDLQQVLIKYYKKNKSNLNFTIR